MTLSIISIGLASKLALIKRCIVMWTYTWY